MSDRPPCARRPSRFLPGLLALATIVPACSPGPSPTEGGVTSKTPEIAKRQKHMEDMLKKSETKSSANPR